MPFPRISVAACEVSVTEHVDHNEIVLWRVPMHGFYPSREIAERVAKGHGCDDSKIRKVSFIEHITPVYDIDNPTRRLP